VTLWAKITEKNYPNIIKSLVQKYNLGCQMSLKIRFLQPQVSFFPENLVVFNDDQGGLIHQDIAKMEQRCQGR
jgi:hypothetical protein